MQVTWQAWEALHLNVLGHGHDPLVVKLPDPLGGNLGVDKFRILEFKVYDSGNRDEGLRFRVLGFGVWGLGVRVKGSGFGFQSLGSRP